MKATLCDVCGKVISEQTLWERYTFWMKDSVYYTDWPKRIDICHDCMEEMKKIIIGRKYREISRQGQIEGETAARAGEVDAEQGPTNAAHRRRTTAGGRRTRQHADGTGD